MELEQRITGSRRTRKIVLSVTLATALAFTGCQSGCNAREEEREAERYEQVDARPTPAPVPNGHGGFIYYGPGHPAYVPGAPGYTGSNTPPRITSSSSSHGTAKAPGAHSTTRGGFGATGRSFGGSAA